MAITAPSITNNSDEDKSLSPIVRIFPLGLLWFVLIPALPFILSLSSISFFIDAEPINITNNSHTHQHTEAVTQVSDKITAINSVFIASLLANNIDYIDFTERSIKHISNMMTYLSVTSVHIIICLIVISFFLYKIHQLPTTIKLRAHTYLLVTTSTYLLIAYVVHLLANDLILTQLGYKSICILLSKAELPTNLVWPDANGMHTGAACFEDKMTHLVWLAYLPIFLGVLAIIFATTFTVSMASQTIDEKDDQWRMQFLKQVKELQISFYLMSIVLVSSTVTILLFTTLPIDLLNDQVLIDALNKLFVSLTGYWGAIFTTTLFATFLPASILLFSKSTQYDKNYNSNTELRNEFKHWLHESVFISSKKQISHVFIILSPMLVGPINELIKSIAGLSG